MEATIEFSRQTNFTGRNGYMKCGGIELMNVSDDNVLLTALTSKKETGRCDISIPKENIIELILKLAIVFNEGKENPTKVTVGL